MVTIEVDGETKRYFSRIKSRYEKKHGRRVSWCHGKNS